MELGAREMAMNGSQRRTAFGREHEEAVQISRGGRARIGPARQMKWAFGSRDLRRRGWPKAHLRWRLRVRYQAGKK